MLKLGDERGEGGQSEGQLWEGAEEGEKEEGRGTRTLLAILTQSRGVGGGRKRGRRGGGRAEIVKFRGLTPVQGKAGETEGERKGLEMVVAGGQRERGKAKGGDAFEERKLAPEMFLLEL